MAMIGLEVEGLTESESSDAVCDDLADPLHPQRDNHTNHGRVHAHKRLVCCRPGQLDDGLDQAGVRGRRQQGRMRRERRQKREQQRRLQRRGR